MSASRLDLHAFPTACACRLAPVVLLLVGCDSRTPTLLADMGEVSARLEYRLGPDGAGSFSLSLVAAEGCPSLLAEAELNGQPMQVEEPGTLEAHSFYLIPTPGQCASPELTLGAPGIGVDDALELNVWDVSASWSMRDSHAFAYAWQADLPDDSVVVVGDELGFTAPALATVRHTSVSARVGEQAVYPSIVDGGDGHYVVAIEEGWPAGTLYLFPEVSGRDPVEECEGFASCSRGMSTFSEFRYELGG